MRLSDSKQIWIGAVAVFAATFWLTATHGYHWSATWFASKAESSSIREGPELTFVYVGSSTCGPSNDPSLAALIPNAVEAVKASARSQGWGFVTVGVAKDNDAIAGLRHLQSLLRFDEVSSGGGWFGLGITKYVTHDMVGTAATPQIVIVRQEIDRFDLTRRGEAVVMRAVGLDQISSWVKAGAQLPRLSEPGR